MMKRIFSLMLAIVLIFSCMVVSTTAAAPAVTIALDATTVTAGEDIVVKMTLPDGLPSMTYVVLSVEFDNTQFSLKSVDGGFTESVPGLCPADIYWQSASIAGENINNKVVTFTFTSKTTTNGTYNFVFEFDEENTLDNAIPENEVVIDGGTATVTVAADPSTCTHSWVAADCETPKTCSICGTTDGEALGHTEEIDAAVAPTCTATGLTEGKHCSVCNKVLVAQTEVAASGHTWADADCETPKTCSVCGATDGEALGHTEVIDAAVAPTCTATGLTEGKKCSVCGEVLVAQEVVEKLAHTEETIPAVAATCTSTGLTEGKKCSVCDEVLVAQEVVAKLAHTEETIPAVAATCIATGLTEGKKCSVCGEILVAQTEVAMVDHTWGEWTVETPATEAAEGTEKRECSFCGEEETRSIPKLDHVHNLTKFDAIASTCKDQGNNEYYTCSGCSKVFKDAEGTTETTVEEETLPLVDHTWGEPAVVDATCTADGSKTYKCTVCEVGEKVEPIAKLGHDFGAYSETKAPTCTEDGEETATCSRCGETDTKVIAKLGHDFGEAVETTPATCTTPGEKTGTCSRCGETTIEAIPALGHDWGEWATTVEPTTESKGEERRDCSRCDAYETRELEALEDDSFMKEWYWAMIALHNRTFEIEAEAGFGGEIDPDGTTKVKYGRTVTYTITPDEGYEIEAVYVDGEDIGAVEEYTFKNVKKDHTITAEFAAIEDEEDAVIDEAIDEEESLYDDVDSDDWFYDDVAFVTENGLMNGVGGDLFAPELNTTRAMIVTILWRLEGEAEAESAGFTDVAADMWYTEAIDWAAANGIVLGYGDGTFGPEINITREQVMAILNRYAAFKGWDDGIAVTMIPQYNCSVWAENNVNWADMNGILADLGVDVYDMTAEADRAEIAAYFTRFCLNVAE